MVPIVQVPGWEQFHWLRAGFSTRHGGTSTLYGTAELNLGFTADDDPAAVRANRRRLVAAVGGPDAGFASVKQVHATNVKRIDRPEEGVTEADGLMTDTTGLLLGILAADCVPILLADTRLRAVAALHAGWRGTAAGIVAAGISALTDAFGSKPQDLVAAIGPSIGPCCYQVGGEVRAAFAADLFHGDHLDLWKANQQQLLAAGVHAVTILGQCTSCTRLDDGSLKYFSHRAEKGRTGRAMGIIGIASTDNARL